MLRKILLSASLVFLLTYGFAQSENSYRQTLKQMFEATGTEEAYKVVINQMITMFKEQYPEMGTEDWDNLEKEFLKTSLNDLTEMLVPVYKKYFTEADLKEMIAFYNSPVGKKFAQTSPMIMKESMVIGQEWGRKIGEDFAKKIEQKSK